MEQSSDVRRAANPEEFPLGHTMPIWPDRTTRHSTYADFRVPQAPGVLQRRGQRCADPGGSSTGRVTWKACSNDPATLRASRFCPDYFFSSQTPGPSITDFPSTARDNDDRIEESRPAPVSRDGPQAGPNQLQIFEKSTLKQRITQQNFLQNGAKIYMSHN